MIEFNREKHWDKIYQIKSEDQLSWYQPYPEISMQFISQYGGGKDARLIDVGGGRSSMAEVLMDNGYHHITVLDISEVALEQASTRLGDRRNTIEWVHTDILDFHPKDKYDVWHDRAAFHFLTNEEEVATYIHLAAAALHQGGLLILATFSEKGPEKCSNLPVHRYSQDQLVDVLHEYFSKLECVNSDHMTPREMLQNFTYCAFRRNHVIVN